MTVLQWQLWCLVMFYYYYYFLKQRKCTADVMDCTLFKEQFWAKMQSDRCYTRSMPHHICAWNVNRGDICTAAAVNCEKWPVFQVTTASSSRLNVRPVSCPCEFAMEPTLAKPQNPESVGLPRTVSHCWCNPKGTSTVPDGKWAKTGGAHQSDQPRGPEATFYQSRMVRYDISRCHNPRKLLPLYCLLFLFFHISSLNYTNENTAWPQQSMWRYPYTDMIKL